MGFRRTIRPGDKSTYSESGSDAQGSWQSDYNETPGIGRQIPIFVGYGVNPARNNGADIEPIPITPVRGQNWPEMQIQLNNGWSKTNYGKRISYDQYLRLLTDSSTKSRRYLIPSRSGNVQFGGGPAPANVQSMVNTTSGAQPNSPGGPGFIASGVDLSGRRSYG